MTERKAIHKLRLCLMQCLNLMEEYSEPDGREISAMADADKLLDSTTEFKPTIEELKQWESNKPWLKTNS